MTLIFLDSNIDFRFVVEASWAKIVDGVDGGTKCGNYGAANSPRCGKVRNTVKVRVKSFSSFFLK